MQRPSLLKLIPLAVLAVCLGAQADQFDPVTSLIENASSPAATPQGLLQTEVPPLHSGVAEPSTQTQALVLASQTPRTLDLISRPDDIWQRIRNGFAVPNIDDPLVTQQQAWFLSHGDYLRRAVARSSRYLYHIVEELEKRGMPTELALLPFIESAYNPMAQSPAQASGMWQFIPSTGKDYNLKQDWWQDERRDVIASTDAALNYLQKIYEMHGDWHLALASYNWGEGAVKRAIDKNLSAGLPADYLSLRMPDETRNYIPKLQAFKNIIADPELFGITLPKIDNEPYFATISNIKGMDIIMAARLAEMPLEDFKALNPSFNRPVIPGSANATLLLPMDRVETFETNLENSTGPLVSWLAYTPKKGEALSKVASRFDMSLSYLLHVNGIKTKAQARPGATLLVQNQSKSNQNGNQPASANTVQMLAYTAEKVAPMKKSTRVSKNSSINYRKNLAKKSTVAVKSVARGSTKVASVLRKGSIRNPS